MRIDQSYLTLGSMVGTSWRPAKTRIFRSPTRSNAPADPAATAIPRANRTRARNVLMVAFPFLRDQLGDGVGHEAAGEQDRAARDRGHAAAHQIGRAHV